MSRVCQITGKKAMVGNHVSHSKRRVKRTFAINLFQDCKLQNVALIQRKGIEFQSIILGMQSIINTIPKNRLIIIDNNLIHTSNKVVDVSNDRNIIFFGGVSRQLNHQVQSADDQFPDQCRHGDRWFWIA